MEDENGVSDESVLYTGTFLNLQDSVQQNMTDKLNAQALLYSRDLAGKQRIIDNYKTTLAEMISLDEDQTATISGLEASNLELTNELAILTEQLGSTESELALKNAQLIAQRAERLKKKRSQIRALTKKAAGSTKAKQIRYNKQAAELLQEFNTSKNPIFTKPFTDDFNLEIKNFE